MLPEAVDTSVFTCSTLAALWDWGSYMRGFWRLFQDSWESWFRRSQGCYLERLKLMVGDGCWQWVGWSSKEFIILFLKKTRRHWASCTIANELEVPSVNKAALARIFSVIYVCCVACREGNPSCISKRTTKKNSRGETGVAASRLGTPWVRWDISIPHDITWP